MLNRLIEPSAGSILLEGKDISTMSADQLREVRRHDINMVFQALPSFLIKPFWKIPNLVWNYVAFPKKNASDWQKKPLIIQAY
ncbi:Glycine betaine transport ATP-binding protein [Streptococcus pyogenes MGAS2096]|nr:Glycine betaine transport ATP-binding protein [Streptococcus pyogenes MGAS2096]